MPKIPTLNATNAMNKLTTSAKKVTDKIHTKLETNVYNKLYKEYEAANTKHNNILTNDVSASKKKNDKTPEIQAQREEEKIKTLLEKMKKFPELHKEKEAIIVKDDKTRQFSRESKIYRDASARVPIIEKQLEAASKEQQHYNTLLAQTDKKIRIVTNLVKSSETQKDSNYNEKRSALNAERNKALKSIGDDPIKLSVAILQFKQERERLETELRANQDMGEKNVDHLESLKMTQTEIQAKLAGIKSNITTLNTQKEYNQKIILQNYPKVDSKHKATQKNTMLEGLEQEFQPRFSHESTSKPPIPDTEKTAQKPPPASKNIPFAKLHEASSPYAQEEEIKKAGAALHNNASRSQGRGNSSIVIGARQPSIPGRS